MRSITRRQQIVSQLLLALVGLFVLLPIWGLAYMAFDSAIKGWPIEFRLWPKTFSLAMFQRMWVRPWQGTTFLSLLRNSLIVAGGAAALSAALGASMAYAFARLRFPGRQVGLFGLLVGALLPPVALMTPLYVLLTALHVRATLFGLMIVYTAFAMPFCVWNMRAAFQAVPKELEESAFLDGATTWMTLWRVTFPLALPAIAVASLIAFLIGYSEFALGWLFVEKPSTITVAMAVSGMMRNTHFGSAASWNDLAALALLMSVPVVVVFLLLRRWLLSGLLMGSVEE